MAHPYPDTAYDAIQRVLHERTHFTAGEVIDALYEAGWHLVTKPELVVKPANYDAEVRSLEGRFDNSLLEIRQVITRYALESSSADLVRHVDVSNAYKYAELVGGHLELPGYKTPDQMRADAIAATEQLGRYFSPDAAPKMVLTPEASHE